MTVELKKEAYNAITFVDTNNFVNWEALEDSCGPVDKKEFVQILD